MKLTRRNMGLGGIAVALAACSRTPTGGSSAPVRAEPAARAVPNAGFDAWVAAFRARAAGQGIAPATLEAAFRDVGYLPLVIERDLRQTENTRTLEDYLSLTADEARVTAGRAMLRRHARLLAAIEARYGVEPQVVAAVWGVESRYGERRGDIPVISALATLAYSGRRARLFSSQLMAALRILQRGDTTPDRMRGSWAGAMGHTQFIPTSYEAYAVDFDGDGRRGIWEDDPTDSLASTAAYFRRSGWRRGRPWGIEVRLPGDFDTSATGRRRTRPVAAWQAAGVRPARGGGSLPDHGPAALIVPAGTAGPAFLTFGNFEVISRYNNAVSYMIAVGYLSDRLAGGGPLAGRFPPDANGLTIDDRRALQRRLTAAGYDTGSSDGVIGPATRAAIEAYQRASGLPVDGAATQALLARLG